MAADTNKWLSIQALRGIAILTVVAVHATVIERKYSGGDLLLPEFFRMGLSGVDLFFAISGFVMVITTRGRFGARPEVLRFLWNRATRIYPTYWFYYCLTLAVFLVKPSWVNATLFHRADLLSSFFLLPSSGGQLVLVSWSLTHELWFYFVFAALMLLRERLFLPLLLVWAAAVVLVNLHGPVDGFSPALRIAFHPFTLEFIAGALAALVVLRRPATRLYSRPVFISGLVIFLLGMYSAYVFHVLESTDFTRAIVFASLYGLLVLSVTGLEQAHSLPVPRFLRFMGDTSYTVYLSHLLVMSAIGRLWALVGPNPDSYVDNIVVCIIMLAAVVGYGWIGYRVIERPVLQLCRRLPILRPKIESRHAPV